MSKGRIDFGWQWWYDDRPTRTWALSIPMYCANMRGGEETQDKHVMMIIMMVLELGIQMELKREARPATRNLMP